MNILILSVGTRNKVVQYFKRTVGTEGKVVVTDASPYAPAVYEADAFYTVPLMSAPGYIDVILDICRKEKIQAVLTLIDPELSLLAAHTADFEALGVTVVGSSYELCERALDKMQMYHWLTEHGYPCAKSYVDKEAFYADVEAGEIAYPVFVKPVRGSASLSISKVYDRETVELLFAHNDGLMIQAFMDGQEIGADVYVDMISGEVISIFTKEKLLMRAGETDKAVSFKDDALFALIQRFVTESGWRGQVDIDLFRIDGTYYIAEVNPRFGGGYPHAYACGCDHMTLIQNNIHGVVNKPSIGQYDEGVYMMKYNEVMVRKG